MPEDAPGNPGAEKVREMQAKLHRWKQLIQRPRHMERPVR